MLTIEERIGDAIEREVPYAEITLQVRLPRKRKWAFKSIGAWGETVERALEKVEAMKREYLETVADYVESPDGPRKTMARLQIWADGTEMVFVPLFF